VDRRRFGRSASWSVPGPEWVETWRAGTVVQPGDEATPSPLYTRLLPGLILMHAMSSQCLLGTLDMLVSC